jgi:tetratricopeptide (TPR) repeat protein
MDRRCAIMSGMAGSVLEGGTELVGRSRECAAIGRLLEGAVRGQSGSLVIRREAGFGKTALLNYADVRAAGMTRLKVRGVESESDLDFAGVHALVRPVIGALTRVPEPQRVALAGALGVGPPAGSDRFLVSAGVLSLLAAAAEERPVLCLIDDAQWLDGPSADSLLFAARRLDNEGLVILFAAREGEQRRFDGPGLDEIALAGVDDESAERLLARVGREIAPSVRERLLVDAGGNPLALIELPGGLSDEQLAGQAMLPESIPLSARLQAAFVQRIERLPRPTRAALLLAAADEASDVAIVLRAAPALNVPQDALDSAEHAGLICVDEGRIRFRHPLVRSAVYESASCSERRRAHSALADAYGDDQYAERRLWHRAVATLSADEGLAAGLAASAERSRLRGGHASAATAFERAARFSETDGSRGRRLADAAAAAWEAGQVDRARRLVADALTLSDRFERARLLYLSGLIEGRCGRLSEAVTVLTDAITDSDDVSLTLEILREGCDMALYAGDYDQSSALASRAADLVCDSDGDRFTAATLSALAAAQRGDHARGAALSAMAIELAERRASSYQCLLPLGGGRRSVRVPGELDERVLERRAGDLQVAGVKVGVEERPDRGIRVTADQDDRVAAAIGCGDARQRSQVAQIGARHRGADRPGPHPSPDLARRSVGDDAALGHQDRTVGVCVGLLQIVGPPGSGRGRLRTALAGPGRPTACGCAGRRCPRGRRARAPRQRRAGRDEAPPSSRSAHGP